MGVPIDRHVADGNMSSEVPVCLNVSIKSEGMGDFVVFKRGTLIWLNSDRGGDRACRTHPAFVKLIFNVQRMAASVAKLVCRFVGVGQNTIDRARRWTSGHLRC